jgi:hypothetical protein
MTGAIVVALHLVLLHAVDGREVSINPEMVTSLKAAKPGHDNALLTKEAHCVVGLGDGTFVSVVESCAAVRRVLETDGR